MSDDKADVLVCSRKFFFFFLSSPFIPPYLLSSFPSIIIIKKISPNEMFINKEAIGSIWLVELCFFNTIPFFYVHYICIKEKNKKYFYI